MSAPLDPTVIRNAILKGFGTGIGVVGLSTLILIPISATMNYFVYHHPVIRLLLGLLGGAAFIFTLPILFFKEKTPYYFGLFPLVTKEPDALAEGSFQWLFRFLNIFTEPFHMVMNTAEYEKSLDSLLLPKEGAAEDYSQHMLLGNDVTVRKEAVSEEFFEAAKDAGHIALSQWATRMKELEDSKIGQTLFVL